MGIGVDSRLPELSGHPRHASTVAFPNESVSGEPMTRPSEAATTPASPGALALELGLGPKWQRAFAAVGASLSGRVVPRRGARRGGDRH